VALVSVERLIPHILHVAAVPSNIIKVRIETSIKYFLFIFSFRFANKNI